MSETTAQGTMADGGTDARGDAATSNGSGEPATEAAANVEVASETTGGRRSGARRLLPASLSASLSGGLSRSRGSEQVASPEDEALLDRITAGRASGVDGGDRSSWGERLRRFFPRYIFSNLTRRIFAFNVVAMLVLMAGVFYGNEFRERLVKTRTESLVIAATVIADAIAAPANVPATETDDPDRLIELTPDGDGARPASVPSEIDFPINPELIAQVLDKVTREAGARARIYDSDGRIFFDSRRVYARGPMVTMDVPSLVEPEPEPTWWEEAWQRVVLFFKDRNLRTYVEHTDGDGHNYREVSRALEGRSIATDLSQTENGRVILSVAVPIQRRGITLGVLQLTTRAGQIDRAIRAEQINFLETFLLSAIAAAILSAFMASRIARPLQRLANAAEKVRRKVKDREEIPDFTKRGDAIGDLSGALRDMTHSLYSRIEAIESFAADVSHELKNPLTSLRSAVETLGMVKRDDQRQRMMEVIEHDVRRLDRLISDISDASRLDAEMAREDYEEVDVAHMLRVVHASTEQVMRAKAEAGEASPRLVLHIDDDGEGDMRRRVMVQGHEGRLGQVVANLVSNARSFVPREGGWIAIDLRTRGEEGDNPQAVVTVADNGPGIPTGKKDKIFERFYTDRPEGEAFGNNSGLGLSIVKQIVDAHNGTIHADNWTLDDRFESDVEEVDEARRGGAIFTVVLPVHRPKRP